MTTLRTVLAIAGMSAALTLAACKAKESPKAAPAPTPAAAAAPPAPVIPPECADYKAAVDKLATCASLPPASREAIKQRFEATARSWAAIPADGRAALAATCKNASAAMTASVAACSH